jgi:hypothetical protein
MSWSSDGMLLTGNYCSIRRNVTDRRLLQYWWNVTDRRLLQYSEKNLSQCHCVYHKYQVDLPGIEPGLRGERPGQKPMVNQNYICININEPFRTAQ